MAHDFHSLYRARTGSSWTNQSVALAPDSSQTSTDDYVVTDTLHCTDPRLRYCDGKQLITKTGDIIPISFDRYKGDVIKKIRIFAKGYYLPN